MQHAYIHTSSFEEIHHYSGSADHGTCPFATTPITIKAIAYLRTAFWTPFPFVVQLNRSKIYFYCLLITMKCECWFIKILFVKNRKRSKCLKYVHFYNKICNLIIPIESIT